MILPTFESTETFSFEQFLLIAEALEKQTDLYRCELLNGRIVMTPPAAAPHALVQDNVHVALSNFVRANRLGRVFGASAGYKMPTGDLLEPDIGFVTTARLPPMKDAKFLDLVPDLAVEIVSPSDPKRDRVEKRAIYERSGVREYWIVDPRERDVILLVLDGGRFRETTLGVRDTLESSVLQGFRIAVREIFDGLER